MAGDGCIQPYVVPHCTARPCTAWRRLAALHGNSLRHRNGRDAPRLGAHDVAAGALTALSGVLQYVLRHLRGVRREIRMQVYILQ